jgi:hypothetical protein
MDFTTIDETAAFTGRVALDEAAPRWLRVAGDQLSARELAEVASTVKGGTCKMLRPSGLGMLRTLIRVARALNPAPHEAIPAWQGMQYMHNMYEGKASMTLVPARKLTPTQVLERLLKRLEKRIESLQRVKLPGMQMVITELEVAQDYLRRAKRYLEE